MELSKSGNVTRLPLFTIARCFSANTVEEIIERLREEDTHFSQAVVKSLASKSPVALKLALRLIREGQNLSWKQCFENEFRVACRRIQDNVRRSLFFSLPPATCAPYRKSFKAWRLRSSATRKVSPTGTWRIFPKWATTTLKATSAHSMKNLASMG